MATLSLFKFGRHLSFASNRMFFRRSSGKVGFIGLGNMGLPMASNLVKGGVNVNAYDLNEKAVKSLEQEGAVAVSGLSDIAQQTTIITMLPAGDHVRSVYLGAGGLLSSPVRGSLFIDCSTTDPQTSIDVGQVAEENGCAFVDAPVSGGVGAAKAAHLTFIVGGSTDGYERAQPLLEQMGKNVIHCGVIGSGQATKICNNMMLGISMIGASEALNLGISLGLDPAVLTKVMNVSSGRSWSTDVYNPCPGVMEGVPASRDYEGGFGTALMTKDLGLAQDAATKMKVAVPLGSMAHQLYRTLCAQGWSEKDFSVVFKYLKGK